MKHSNNEMSEERMRDLQLLYLEDMLDPGQKKEFEEHLRTCDDCSRQLEELTQWVNTLKNNKEAFCPELWEVYEQVRGREDSARVIHAHLDQCPSCREDANALKAGTGEKVMPAELWDSFKAQFPEPVAAKPEGLVTQWLSGFMEQLSALFRPPLIAAGAVAAAILVVLILYPGGVAPPVVGLSSVTWKEVDLRSRVMGTPPPVEQRGTVPLDRERVAILIFFRDFKKPFTQERIDSLYWAVKPTESITDRFDVLPPARIKETLSEKTAEADTRQKLLERLHEKLGVAQVVALTVAPSANGFGIQSERLDARTGEVLRKGISKDASVEDLPSELNAAAQFLFKTQ